MMVDWIELALFMATIALVALYGLAISGHFPAEFRADDLKTGAGSLILWTTFVVAVTAAVTAVIVAIRVLPWFATVIGAGGMLLLAPLVLRPFPDRFVNGRLALVTFGSGALLGAIALWIVA